MRPEMTRKAIESILSWSKLTCLTIVIDGLRSFASLEEELWRNETIAIATKFDSAKVDLLVYQDNIGITDHVNRVQKKLLPKYPKAIWVEEDFSLDLDNYTSGLDLNFNDKKPFLSCANAQADHLGNDKRLRTLFPPYWGQVLNIELTLEIEKLRKDRRIDLNIARNILTQLSYANTGFPKSYLISKQVDYWNKYFSWAVESKNRWDALATYVLWKYENPTYVTNRNLVKDLGMYDFRGMNVRHESQEPNHHLFQPTKVANQEICFLCEKRKSRVAFSFKEAIGNNLKYKTRIWREKKRIN